MSTINDMLTVDSSSAQYHCLGADLRGTMGLVLLKVDRIEILQVVIFKGNANDFFAKNFLKNYCTFSPKFSIPPKKFLSFRTMKYHLIMRVFCFHMNEVLFHLTTSSQL